MRLSFDNLKIFCDFTEFKPSNDVCPHSQTEHCHMGLHWTYVHPPFVSARQLYASTLYTFVQNVIFFHLNMIIMQILNVLWKLAG